MPKLPQHIEELFNKEFWDSNLNRVSVHDRDPDDIKSFIATILNEERERIIKKVENQITSDIAFIESVNRKIRYQSYKELIIDAIRQ